MVSAALVMAVIDIRLPYPYKREIIHHPSPDFSQGIKESG